MLQYFIQYTVCGTKIHANFIAWPTYCCTWWSTIYSYKKMALYLKTLLNPMRWAGQVDKKCRLEIQNDLGSVVPALLSLPKTRDKVHASLTFMTFNEEESSPVSRRLHIPQSQFQQRRRRRAEIAVLACSNIVVLSRNRTRSDARTEKMRGPRIAIFDVAEMIFMRKKVSLRPKV